MAQETAKLLASDGPQTVAVVIPCYRVTAHVLGVIEKIPADITQIICVDDACPDNSGAHIRSHCHDPRVTVLDNPENLGVGGATKRGFRQALQDGADVVVKLDGDGQMDPALIPALVAPILSAEADYTKGNRFFTQEAVSAMPRIRLFGNMVLTLMAKLSSGYWNIFDPTNGFVAIHARVLEHLPLNKIADRYFFETDMLFRLNTLRARVIDVPMAAYYGEEESNLKIGTVLLPFLWGHARNLVKRFVYIYLLRDFNLASLLALTGIPLFLFSLIYGLSTWITNAIEGVATPTGTIMVVSVGLLSSIQFLMSAFNVDVSSVPNRAIHPFLQYPAISGANAMERKDRTDADQTVDE
ncbi:MAG: hypothetical protein Alpg2KO_29280 [Alphaproteobacteria bacterium]